MVFRIYKSRPVRACGLKPNRVDRLKCLGNVTPRAGVWIETLMPAVDRPPAAVTPRAGVWIETLCCLVHL